MVTLLISGLVCSDERGDELRCGLLFENGLGERLKLVATDVFITEAVDEATGVGPQTRLCMIMLLVAWLNVDAAAAAGA